MRMAPFLAVALACAAVATATARAQQLAPTPSLQLGLGGGFNVPVGASQDTVKTGFHLQGMVQLTAYLETVGVGDPLPDAPLFLAPEWYVNVPLEQTYLASWNATPEPIRELVQ